MQTLLQDLRYAARQLVRAPGFAIVAVVTLALGIGANTALFTLANAVLARPLPGVHDTDRLRWVAPVSERGGHPLNMSYLDFLDYRSAGVFSELAAMDQAQFSISSGAEPERVRGQIVSGNFFSLLRVPMALGRGFAEEEDRTPGAHPVVVIGFDLWQRRFAGDPAIIGRTLMVNGAAFTIVGVAPERFNGPDHAERRDVWVPLMMAERALPRWPRMLESRQSWWLRAIGRLAPGVSAERADAAVATIAARIAKADSAGHHGVSARTFAMRSGMTPGDQEDVYPVAALAAIVTGLVLLIACANVSNLLLGRAVARRREIGVRLSLGAGRWRIVRQLLTESVLLAALAALLGFLLALWGVDLLVAQIPAPLDVAVDRRVLSFTAAAALFTGVVFGIVPAIHATRANLVSALKDSLIGMDASRARLQGGFAIAQISLSLVLLVTASMFLRGLYKASRIDVGFEATTRVLAMSFDLALQGYTPEQAGAFLNIVGERAAGMPGVERVSFADQVPMGERIIGNDIVIESDKPRSEARFDPVGSIGTYQYTIRPNYFATLGVALIRGRDFSASDVPSSPPVVIVSEQFARAAWKDENPVGKRLSVHGPEGPYATVIGVAREALIAGTGERNRPIIYLPQLQHPRTMDVTLLVRAHGDARVLAASLRRELALLDRTLPIYGVQTLAQYRSDRLAESRLGSGMLGGFGALALLLATVGVYAVIAFSVGQRTREIGVRVALGALQEQVVLLFVRQGLRLTLIGMAVGLALSIAVAKLLSSLFFGLAMSDIPTIVAVAAMLGLVALGACWIPARRAARVDPMQALRQE